jgi:hypothetical protein
MQFGEMLMLALGAGGAAIWRRNFDVSIGNPVRGARSAG